MLFLETMNRKLWCADWWLTRARYTNHLPNLWGFATGPHCPRDSLKSARLGKHGVPPNAPPTQDVQRWNYTLTPQQGFLNFRVHVHHPDNLFKCRSGRSGAGRGGWGGLKCCISNKFRERRCCWCWIPLWVDASFHFPLADSPSSCKAWIKHEFFCEASPRSASSCFLWAPCAF